MSDQERPKVIPFTRIHKSPQEPPSDAQKVLCEAADFKPVSVIVLAQDAEGYWIFQCTAGIEKTTMMGMLEFMKLDLFNSMSSKQD
jgi:hypothetical protein